MTDPGFEFIHDTPDVAGAGQIVCSCGGLKVGPLGGFVMSMMTRCERCGDVLELLPTCDRETP